MRLWILIVAAIEIAVGLWRLVNAIRAAKPPLPTLSDPATIHLLLTCVVFPILAIIAFTLAWQRRRLTLAAILVAVQPVEFFFASAFLSTSFGKYFWIGDHAMLPSNRELS